MLQSNLLIDSANTNLFNYSREEKKELNSAAAMSAFEKVSKERKQSVKDGETPDFYITQGYMLYQRNYAYNGETIREAFKRIAEIGRHYKPNPELAKKKFFDLMWKGFLAPSTPVYLNTNNNRGDSVSCSGGYVSDSVSGFYTGLREGAMLSKRGYGTSGYLGDIRPRGTPISKGGTADGALPVFKLFHEMARHVSQANARRGVWAGYIGVMHGDFDEIWDYCFKHPSETNVGWLFHQKDIDALNANDPEMVRRWNMVMFLRARYGKGYIVKPDTMNEFTSEAIKKSGIPIKASNLCVTGDTLLHTDQGMISAKELYERKTTFGAIADVRTEIEGASVDHSQDHYSTENLSRKDREAAIKLSGNVVRETNGMHLIDKNAVVYRITFKSGNSIKVTAGHKLYVYEKDTSNIVKKRVSELRTDLDRVLTQSEEGSWGTDGTFELGYTLGSVLGDGSMLIGEKYGTTSDKHSETIRAKFWDNRGTTVPEFRKISEALAEQGFVFKEREYTYRNSDINEFNMNAKSTRAFVKYFDLKSKAVFPTKLYTCNRDTVVGFIQGLFDADGCSFRTYYGKDGKFTFGLQMVSINQEMLLGLQKLLNNFGVQSRVFLHRKEASAFNDPHTGKEYERKPTYRIDIASKDTIKLMVALGGKIYLNSDKQAILDETIAERNRVFNNVPLKDALSVDTITSIEECAPEPVYDTTQLVSHSLIFNGLVSSNCSEIALPHNEEYSFSCVLSSLNLSKWFEFDEDTIFWSTIFLDCVVEQTLEETEGVHEIEPLWKFTRDFRALGLGALGWHTLLQQLSLPFDSLKAKLLNKQIFSKMYSESMKASQHLASVHGAPKFCKDFGYANATLLAIAPNTSSALLAGGVSQGIEPLVSNTYNQNTAGGEVARMNPTLIKLLQERGKYSDELVADLQIARQGSVAHLDFLSDHEKRVFAPAFEINQDKLVDQASDRQPYICQAQSLNLFSSGDEHELARVSKRALNMKNVKSLYYLRAIRSVRGSSGEAMSFEGACKSCEA